ncbi:MAG: tetratricopeptide repeat protein [Chitinophagales bacterium]|nr:tetratricopeptide repeat protein [Chitinophagales bacterium]MDW8418120.1 tetratricopeptide repeat protein [Chitinophagales bacterium]
MKMRDFAGRNFIGMVCFAFVFIAACGERKSREEVMDKEIKEYRAFYDLMRNYRQLPYDSLVNATVRHLALHPDDVSALTFYGRLLYDAHCYDSALAAYKRAIAYDRKYVHAYLGAGAIYNILNKLDSARHYYSAALALGDSTPHGHFGLALLYTKLKDEAEALAHLDSALARNDSLPMVYSGLCLVAHKFGRKELAEKLYNMTVASGMTDTIFFKDVLNGKFTVDSLFRRNRY